MAVRAQEQEGEGRDERKGNRWRKKWIILILPISRPFLFIAILLLQNYIFELIQYSD